MLEIKYTKKELLIN